MKKVDTMGNRLGEWSISLSLSNHRTNVLAQNVHKAHAVKKRAVNVPATQVRKGRRVDQRFNGNGMAW